MTAKYLKSIKFDRIYSSDLSRAKETAELIWNEQSEATFHVTKELREGYGGELEGRIFGTKLGNSEISSLNSLRSLINNHGEKLEDVFLRTKNFFDRLVNSLKKESVICVVSHGGPIRLFIGFIQGVTHEEIIGMKLGNCSITEVEYADGNWSIISANSIEHLGDYYSQKILAKSSK